MRKSWKRITGFIAMIIFAPILLAACTPDVATTSASCAFIVGTGESGYDAKLHGFLYPGQLYTKKSGEKPLYFPCNSRNYLITDGTDRDANGSIIGDITEPIVAYTDSGTAVNVLLSAYWTPNQSQNALALFYEVCFKYQCASPTDISGTSNNSTPGWTDMLGETFLPALKRAARTAGQSVSDDIWKTHDEEQMAEFERILGEEFMNEVKKSLGYNDELFCGSGNSKWTNPDNPGAKGNNFTCVPVRIEVDSVELKPDQQDQNPAGIKALNQERYDASYPLYGEETNRTLSTFDTIERCQEAGLSCTIVIGSGNSPAVAVPANVPPTTTPTATAAAQQ